MPERKKTTVMFAETALLSVFSVSLQGFGLLLNIFLTRRLGAASVGALTLMGSFYGLAAVLSGGSGFIGASRLMSEEIGCAGDPRRVFGYTLRFCMGLSCSAAVLLCLIAPWLTGLVPDAAPHTIRLLSLTLPVSALSACCKGRCYAFHRVYVPAIAECIEFLLRAGTLAFCTVFLIPYGRLTVLDAFALSMMTGQLAATVFLAFIRVPYPASGDCRLRFGQFLRLMLPIMGNACLVALLGSANDALVPLTLLQYGNSTEEALSQFGEFEAIILPTLFFPSVMQCCMSGLLVPELSQAKAAGDSGRIRSQTQNVLEQTVSFSLFVALIIYTYGGEIGTLLGGNAFTGTVLRWMAPIIPCIYLEIIMEGVLRGLGKQNFSSVNYLAEYTVRISVLLICVPLFGFYGIVASYMACNITGNSVRLLMVLRAADLKPDWKQILLIPAGSLLLSWQTALLLRHLLSRLHVGTLAEMILFALWAGGMFLFVRGVLRRLFSDKSHARGLAQGI